MAASMKRPNAGLPRSARLSWRSQRGATSSRICPRDYLQRKQSKRARPRGSRDSASASNGLIAVVDWASMSTRELKRHWTKRPNGDDHDHHFLKAKLYPDCLAWLGMLGLRMAKINTLVL